MHAWMLVCASIVLSVSHTLPCPELEPGDALTVDPAPLTMVATRHLLVRVECPAVEVAYAGSDGTRVVMTFDDCCRHRQDARDVRAACSPDSRVFQGDKMLHATCQGVAIRDSIVCFMRSESMLWRKAAVPSPVYAMAGLGQRHSGSTWVNVLAVDKDQRHWLALIDVGPGEENPLQAGELRLFDPVTLQRCTVPVAAFIYVAHDESPSTFSPMPSPRGYVLGVVKAGASIGSGLTSASHAVWSNVLDGPGASDYRDAPSDQTRAPWPAGWPTNTWSRLVQPTYMRLLAHDAPALPVHAQGTLELLRGTEPMCSGSWVEFPGGLRGVLTAGHCVFQKDGDAYTSPLELSARHRGNGVVQHLRLATPNWRRTSAASLMLRHHGFKSRPATLIDMSPDEVRAVVAISAIGLEESFSLSWVRDLLSPHYAALGQSTLSDLEAGYDIAILLPMDPTQSVPPHALSMQLMDAVVKSSIVETVGSPILLNSVPMLHPPHAPMQTFRKVPWPVTRPWSHWGAHHAWSMRVALSRVSSFPQVGGTALVGAMHGMSDHKPPHLVARDIQGMSGSPAFLLPPGSVDGYECRVSAILSKGQGGQLFWGVLHHTMEAMWSPEYLVRI